jgi:hypothetical protein
MERTRIVYVALCGCIGRYALHSRGDFGLLLSRGSIVNATMYIQY